MAESDSESLESGNLTAANAECQALYTEDSFGAYLKSLDSNESRCIRDVVTPLAYAAGNGLPRSIWGPLVAALSERRYVDEDIDRILQREGRLFQVTHEDERTVYRLSSPAIDNYVRHSTARRPSETQGIFCQTLLDLTPFLESPAQKDWRAADPYMHRYMIQHAAAAGSIDFLTNDPLFLATAHPPHVIKALQALPPSNASRRVYRFSLPYLRAGCADDNLSYLQLRAYQTGEAAFAEGVDALSLPRKWSTCWAHYTNEAPHCVVGRHGDQDNAKIPAVGHAWRGAHSVDVGDLDGKTIAISCGCDGKIRMFDLEEARPTGAPFLFFGKSIEEYWSQPMCLALCRHQDRILLVTLTASGKIFAWEWLHSFEQIGKIADVLHVDRREQMTVWSTKEQSLIVACGAWLELIRWDASGYISHSIQGITTPPMAALGMMASGEIVIASADSTGMAAFRLDGSPLWRKELLQRKPYPGGPLQMLLDRISYDERVTSVAASSVAGGIAIFGTDDGNICLRSLETGEFAGNSILAHQGAVTCLSVLDQGSSSVLVSGGGDSAIKLWNLPDLTPVGRALRGHQAFINSLKVWPVAGVPAIISASADATVRVWDFPRETQALQRASEPVIAVASCEIDHAEAGVTWSDNGAVEFWTSECGDSVEAHVFSIPRELREKNMQTGQDLPYGNRMAATVLPTDPRVAIGLTRENVVIFHLTTGETTMTSMPGKMRRRRKGTYIWCICLGVVNGKLARVAFRDRNREESVEVFDLESDEPLSVRIEAHSPLATLRLGEISGHPVILTRKGALLSVVKLSDQSPVGSPFSVEDFAYPADVGELHGKPVAVVGASGRTDIRVIPLHSPDRRLTIDVGARVSGLALARTGILVGSAKGLLKLDVASEAVESHLG